MKTKLEYEFKDNDDDSRFYMITNGDNFYFTLLNLDNELHDISKYPEKAEKLGLDVDTVDSIRSMLHGFMADNGVDFEHVN